MGAEGQSTHFCAHHTVRRELAAAQPLREWNRQVIVRTPVGETHYHDAAWLPHDEGDVGWELAFERLGQVQYANAVTDTIGEVELIGIGISEERHRLAGAHRAQVEPIAMRQTPDRIGPPALAGLVPDAVHLVHAYAGYWFAKPAPRFKCACYSHVSELLSSRPCQTVV